MSRSLSTIPHSCSPTCDVTLLTFPPFHMIALFPTSFPLFQVRWMSYFSAMFVEQARQSSHKFPNATAVRIFGYFSDLSCYLLTSDFFFPKLLSPHHVQRSFPHSRFFSSFSFSAFPTRRPSLCNNDWCAVLQEARLLIYNTPPVYVASLIPREDKQYYFFDSKRPPI